VVARVSRDSSSVPTQWSFSRHAELRVAFLERKDANMKRIVTLLTAAAIALAASQTLAHEHSAQMAGMEKAAKKTVVGEVVDTGCYMAHAAKGEKHVACATKCINQGMPMGLLTDNGTLYLLTLNHDNADPYNKLKSEAGKKVKVTGAVWTRGGMKSIDVEEFQPVAVNATK